jgi:hypothetical protein
LSPSSDLIIRKAWGILSAMILFKRINETITQKGPALQGLLFGRGATPLK